MTGPSVIAPDRLDRIRALLTQGKKVDWVANFIGAPRAHVIEAGFGAGLRYIPKDDVMTARPASLDHEPQDDIDGDACRYPKATEIPARLLPPRPRPAPEPPVNIVIEEQPEPTAEHGGENGPNTPDAVAHVESVDALLEQARLTDNQRVQAAARSVVLTAAVLDETLRRAAAEADIQAARQRLETARAEVERAQADYHRLVAFVEGSAQARAQVGATEVRELLTSYGISNAEVRAWARTADFPCPTTGTVPRRVLDAWINAHHPQGAA